MKNLFAAASYSFNNFYNNLNTQGQMIFSIIIFLIVILCILLFITYVFQGIQSKVKISKIKKETKKVEKEALKKEVQVINEEAKEPLYTNEKTEIEDIASAISDALKEESPISLTNFEEDQEKTAIISIDELMQKAKELELIDDDENTGINFLEKYNLEPAEVESASNIVSNTSNKEVKAFKVSQVISPIYGVKKEVINNNDKEA
ncbi:MAG: hypothetical protein ACI4U0_00020 [Candidatus Aphodocola sp.]